MHYASPEQAGETVTVEARDGGDPSDRCELRIRLRGNGKGSTELVVPTGWTAVVLSSPNSAEHRIPVAPRI